MTPPRRLSDLVVRPVGVDPVITNVTSDSRKVGPGSLFAALPGATVDGRTFIPAALQKGAAAVLVSEDTEGDGPVPLIRTHDVRRAFALAAGRFWGEIGRAHV